MPQRKIETLHNRDHHDDWGPDTLQGAKKRIPTGIAIGIAIGDDGHEMNGQERSGGAFKKRLLIDGSFVMLSEILALSGCERLLLTHETTGPQLQLPPRSYAY